MRRLITSGRALRTRQQSPRQCRAAISYQPTEGMDQQDRLALEYLSRELAKNETRIYDHISITFRWLD